MSRLTAAARRALPASAFGWPSAREYPVTDRAHVGPARARVTEELRRGRLGPRQAHDIRARIDKIAARLEPGPTKRHAGDMARKQSPAARAASLKNLAKARKARQRNEALARRGDKRPARSPAKRAGDPPAKRRRSSASTAVATRPQVGYSPSARGAAFALLGSLVGGGAVAGGAVLADHYQWLTPHARAAVVGGAALALGTAVGIASPAIGAGIGAGGVVAATLVAIAVPGEKKKAKSTTAAHGAHAMSGPEQITPEMMGAVNYDDPAMAGVNYADPAMAGVQYNNLLGRRLSINPRTGEVSL